MLNYGITPIRNKKLRGRGKKKYIIIYIKVLKKYVTTITLRELSSSALVNLAFFVLHFLKIKVLHVTIICNKDIYRYHHLCGIICRRLLYKSMSDSKRTLCRGI